MVFGSSIIYLDLELRFSINLIDEKHELTELYMFIYNKCLIYLTSKRLY